MEQDINKIIHTLSLSFEQWKKNENPIRRDITYILEFEITTLLILYFFQCNSYL